KEPRGGAQEPPRAGPRLPSGESGLARILGKLRRAPADLVPRGLVGDLDVERRLELHVLQHPGADVVLLAAVHVHAGSAVAAEVTIRELPFLVELQGLL